MTIWDPELTMLLLVMAAPLCYTVLTAAGKLIKLLKPNGRNLTCLNTFSKHIFGIVSFDGKECCL